MFVFSFALRTVMTVAALTLTFESATGQGPAPGAPGVEPVLRIGILNDRSGVYAGLSGEGSVVAARMAVAEVGGSVGGRRIELLVADHRNDATTGRAIAAKWLDEDGVEMIADVPNTGVALAVTELVTARNKVHLNSGAGSSDMTGKRCSPNFIHWTYDTWAMANSTVRSLTTDVQKTWYFVTADYAFGDALQRDAAERILTAGGTVVGAVRHPLGTTTLKPQLEAARDAGAHVIALANAGGDTTLAVREAAQIGLWRSGQRLTGLLVFITDIHQLGLQTAQGLLLTESFYWNLNDDTRRFSQAFAERHGGAKPTMVQAGVYSAVRHYLKAVGALGTPSDGAAVVAKMKDLPTEDLAFGAGRIRPDGRKLHDMYLFEVKSPRSSNGPWDYYKLVRSIPAAEAFRPLLTGGCPLVGKS